MEQFTGNYLINSDIFAHGINPSHVCNYPIPVHEQEEEEEVAPQTLDEEYDADQQNFDEVEPDPVIED